MDALVAATHQTLVLDIIDNEAAIMDDLGHAARVEQVHVLTYFAFLGYRLRD